MGADDALRRALMARGLVTQAELDAEGGEALGKAEDVSEEVQRAESGEGSDGLQGKGRVSTRQAVKR